MTSGHLHHFSTAPHRIAQCAAAAGGMPRSTALSTAAAAAAAYSFLEVSHDGNGGLSACVFFCFDYDDDDDYNSSGASVLLFTFPCANFYAHSCTSSL